MKIDKYKKMFRENSDYVSCDFSVLIPSWKIEFSDRWNIKLVRQAIDESKKMKYYSFYSVIPENKLNEYLQFFKDNFPQYLTIIEETVPENEKPISLLFWDWLFSSISFDARMCIAYHVLPQEFRNE